MEKRNQKNRRRFGETLVTSGEFRGRKIRTPGGETHPMGIREKLALFNMISDWLDGAFVLDAYAGSGALGIEAISRGAKLVLFTDKSPVAVDVVNMNLEYLGIPKEMGGAIRKDILAEAPSATDRFGIVLADPPYDKYSPEMITDLAILVAPGGILVASTPIPGPEISGMEILKARKYARAHITIYKWKNEKDD